MGGNKSPGPCGRARRLGSVHLRLRRAGHRRREALDSSQAPERDRARAFLRARSVARTLLPLSAALRVQGEEDRGLEQGGALPRSLYGCSVWSQALRPERLGVCPLQPLSR